jgi:hypothetical protein
LWLWIFSARPEAPAGGIIANERLFAPVEVRLTRE